MGDQKIMRRLVEVWFVRLAPYDGFDDFCDVFPSPKGEWVGSFEFSFRELFRVFWDVVF